MRERRTARRRSFPYIRSAVLQVGERSHIVAVTDVSAQGAFLATRVPLGADEPIQLKMILPRASREISIPCHVVRKTGRLEPGSGRPTGIAVRFEKLDGTTRELIQGFSGDEMGIGAPGSSVRVEYRVLERRDVEGEELNRFGLEGWELAATLPQRPAGVRLIMMRRL